MSEETLSEFVDELTRRNEPLPRDLIEKYAKKGLAASEMASALLARAALNAPDAPPSALELSEKRLAELIEGMESRTGPAERPKLSWSARLWRSLGRLVGRRTD